LGGDQELIQMWTSSMFYTTNDFHCITGSDMFAAVLARELPEVRIKYHYGDDASALALDRLTSAYILQIFCHGGEADPPVLKISGDLTTGQLSARCNIWARHNLKMVVLSGCFTAQHAQAISSVPAIGFSNRIAPAALGVWSKGLYRELLVHGASLADALSYAKDDVVATRINPDDIVAHVVVNDAWRAKEHLQFAQL
jgi:hypothetical protein